MLTGSVAIDFRKTTENAGLEGHLDVSDATGDVAMEGAVERRLCGGLIVARLQAKLAEEASDAPGRASGQRSRASGTESGVLEVALPRGSTPGNARLETLERLGVFRRRGLRPATCATVARCVQASANGADTEFIEIVTKA